MEATINPNERLTTDEVSKLFKIRPATLRMWRTYRKCDKSYPRFYKLHKMVYYIRHEIEEDLKGVCV